VNKTATTAAQLAKCILLHTYSRTTASFQCASTNKNFISLISKLAWIFGQKLRTD